MKADPYEYVSKDNIVTYSYVEDYAAQKQKMADSRNLKEKVAQTLCEKCLRIIGKLYHGK